MNRIVIYGASGFLGQALVERLIIYGQKNILAVARNEGQLVALKEKFPSVEIMIGDISDEWSVSKSMKGASEVYLLSAVKHVGIAEKEVKSCINTNIIGCMNVINESIKTKPSLLMFISSDKASRPMGVYGCSKKIGEKLIEEAAEINPYTKYRVCRYGNVLYSTGSVLCKWKDRMIEGKEVLVTDFNATRFFWSIKKAVDLIFDCINNAPDAKPFIPSMKSIRIGDLLEAMMEKYGRVSVKEIGLQNGENLHETITEYGLNSFDSPKYTREEILKLI